MNPKNPQNPQRPKWMNDMLKRPQEDVFLGSDLSIHRNPADAVERSLGNESAWNTGVNCPQDANNLRPPK